MPGVSGSGCTGERWVWFEKIRRILVYLELQYLRCGGGYTNLHRRSSYAQLNMHIHTNEL